MPVKGESSPHRDMIKILLLVFLFTTNISAGELPADIKLFYPPKEIAPLKNLLNRVEKEGLPQEYFFNKIRQAHLKNIPAVNLEKTLVNEFASMKEARNLLSRASFSGDKIQNYQNSLIFLTELLQRGVKPVEFLYLLRDNRSRKIPVDELLYFLEQLINLKQLCGFSDKTSQELISNFYQYHQSYEPILNAIEKIRENKLPVEQYPELTNLMDKFSRKQISEHKFIRQLKELSRESIVDEIKK